MNNFNFEKNKSDGINFLFCVIKQGKKKRTNDERTG